jgi:hypothetical protein
MARAPIDSTFMVDLLPAMLLVGVGFGAAMPVPPASRLPRCSSPP